MNRSFDEVLIIIPTYNEALNVSNLARTLIKLYPGAALLFVDDNSPDSTSGEVLRLQKEFKNIHLISRSGKYGIGTAYLEGFAWAKERDFQSIVQMDADFSHDPKVIKDLLKELVAVDWVIGSRFCTQAKAPGLSYFRLGLSYFASMLIRLFLGLPIKDPTGGFKAYKKETLCHLESSEVISKGYIFQTEVNYLLFKKGLKFKEIPIEFGPRLRGKSKISVAIVIEAVVNLLKFKKP